MLQEMLEWYDLTEEERAIRDLALQVAREEIAPRAEKHDLEGTFVRDSIDALGESGLLGVNVPKKYGGLGGSLLASVMAVEIVSAACGSTGASYSFHVGTVNLINGCGPEEVRRKYLPGLAKDKLGAFAMNEATRILLDRFETIIEDRGDYYLVNGEKPFVTSAGEADVYVLHSQRANSPFQGFWAIMGQEYILIDGGDPGLATTRIYDPMGLRGASNGTLKVQDLRAPRENLLGEDPWGFMKALIVKEESVVGPQVVAMGIAGAALDAAVRHTRQKGDEEWIRHLIAQMSSRLDALRSYNYFAARLEVSNFYETVHRNMALRLRGGEDGPWICERAMEIMGGSSYMRSSPIQRYYRDAKGATYLMFPMDRRRHTVGMMLYQRDAMAEYPERDRTSMPWQPNADFMHRMMSGRAIQQYPEQGQRRLSRRAVEGAAREVGQEEMTLEFYMRHLLRFVSDVEGVPLPHDSSPEAVPQT